MASKLPQNENAAALDRALKRRAIQVTAGRYLKSIRSKSDLRIIDDHIGTRAAVIRSARDLNFWPAH